ncbi:MAG: methyltransferase domain-containing protein [Candidatus Lokiarchaeota archaeon]|nr:methyltransferase domain-containing protein [Candidatus Lokiarchaeota archaeon]
MVKFIDKCPVCNSNDLNLLLNHNFKSNDIDIEQIQNKRVDYSDIANYILFNHILDEEKEEFEFWISFCNNCGFLFTNPRFSDKDIENKYTTLNDLIKGGEDTINEILNKNYFRINDLYNLLRSYNILNKGNKEILDYGGGAGYMLLPFYKENKCDVLDYIDWKLPEHISYLGKDLNDLPENKKYDLILLLHTLEHVRNPVELLKNISTFLKDNGKIIIQVPLGSFLEWKKLKEPLTHINFFSEQSIYNVVKLAGLNVIHIKTKPQKFPSWIDWEIELIVGRKKNINIPVSEILTTKQQFRREYYYYIIQLLEILKSPRLIWQYLKKFFRSFLI